MTRQSSNRPKRRRPSTNKHSSTRAKPKSTRHPSAHAFAEGSTSQQDIDMVNGMLAGKREQRRRARQFSAKQRRDRKRHDQHLAKLRGAGHKWVCIYDGRPRDKQERHEREQEQAHIASLNGKDWNALSHAERQRRIRFGSTAHCRNTKDVRDLTRINGRICRTKEREATDNWTLDADDKRQLLSILGFFPCAGLIASNKAVRVKTASIRARAIEKLRARPLHWYFITLTSADWHTQHNDTEIRLGEIRQATIDLMAQEQFHWIGCIEFDICNNWRGGVGGLVVMPHVHILAWREDKISARKLQADWCENPRLKPFLGRPTVTVKTIRKAKDISHRCFYMGKPNNLVKSFRMSEDGAELVHVYSVENSARPSQVLRISEILSHLTWDDILMGGGQGARLTERWLHELRSWLSSVDDSAEQLHDIGEFWARIRPARSRKTYGPVRIIR